MRNLVVIACAGLGALLPVGTRAQAPERRPDQAAPCAKLPDAERLKCYDAAFGAKPGETGVPEKPPSRWEIKRETSKLTGKENVSAALVADETRVSSRTYGTQRAARLVVTCEDGKLGLFISFPEDLVGGSRGVNATFRIGTKPPQKAHWQSAPNSRDYGPFASPAASQIIEDLTSAKEFSVRTDPDVYGSTEALFKLDGVVAAVGEVRAACNPTR